MKNNIKNNIKKEKNRKESIIEGNNINFKYGDTEILKNINLDIKEGNFISIIGPNGSGKTTLLKKFLKILNVKKNEILYLNKDLLSYSNIEFAKMASYVPQFGEQNIFFSVEDVVMFGRNPYLKRFQEESIDDKKIVEDVMKLTGVWEFRDKYITELSGGELQRVIIARVLAQESKVIFLDEPISHLDIHYQIEILKILNKVKKDKSITIVAVLHDLNMAIEYSDKIVMLNNGIVEKYGDIDEVITKELIKKVYKINFEILTHPKTGKKYFLPDYK
ncbi:ABC transporter ATP-binding protein [Haliovirga abyssi]|uniref:ABC transporter n=1 Tax=Haliovirga abyssi TaxID=2996794 RepID=A0AAU9DCD0_9FUSO|nr:ABC transporter ATP-binding protein [Haliovirga abyssi]BDU51141.1 ABC transporter [Haliovirga abyssi]